MQFKNFQLTNLAGQHEVLRENKVDTSRRYMGNIMRGKERKLLESGVKKEDIHLSEEDILKDIRDSYDFNADNTLIQVPTEHPFDVGEFILIVASGNVSWEKTLRGYYSIKVLDVVHYRITTLILSMSPSATFLPTVYLHAHTGLLTI